jgi:exonuclease III
MLIGDFNSNTIWDYKKHRLVSHAGVVKQLGNKGIFSTYHFHHKQTQGTEEHPTFYMYRHKGKPYHIDYCFVSTDMLEKLQSVDIGEYDFWAKYSDHVPMIVTFYEG